jgi:hypothetical protein
MEMSLAKAEEEKAKKVYLQKKVIQKARSTAIEQTNVNNK